jgi:Fanconi-associated nuclease 1
LSDCLPSEATAIVRAGRRLARSLRATFPPAPALSVPTERTVHLLPAAGDGRRHWHTRWGPGTVEDAVALWLAGHGRSALYVEGALLSTICALLLAELLFLPVPGALPVPTLSGPLDLGTPAFRAARRGAWDDLVAAVEAGEAPARVRAADDRWRGVRLAGARWDAADRDALVCATAGIVPAALVVLLEKFADEGPRSMAGLPDLAVLPGPPVKLPDTFPSKLPSGLVFAEVKGPGDTLRDTQAVWLDRLVRAGAAVEVWRVEAVSR